MNKQTLICKDLMSLIEDIGEVCNLIQMKDMIKYGENDSFKDRLRRFLENTIDHLSNTTTFYKVKYVEVEDIDAQMDINIIMSRLFYYTTHLSATIRNKRRDEKRVNRDINGIVYYIKMISSIYDIDHTRFVKKPEDYLLKNEE